MSRIRVAGIVPMGDGFAFMHRKDVVKRKDIQEYYTFPGGGLEEGESLEEGTIREIKEELGVTIETDGFIATIEHDYPDFHLIMDCYYAHVVEGVIKANEHMALRWISVDEIEGLEWLPADWKVLPFVREKAMHLEDSELNSEHIQKR